MTEHFRVDTGEIRRRVEKHYNQRKELFVHLAVFLIVNAVMWFIWLFTRGMPEDQVFAWPMIFALGWGAGLVAHGIDVISQSPGVLARLDKKARDQMTDIYGPGWEDTDAEEDYARRHKAVHQRARQQTEFAIHLVVFTLINLLMWFIWAVANDGTLIPFPLIIMGLWGAGLGTHGAAVFFDSSRYAAARERAVQRAISSYEEAYDAAPAQKRKRRERLLTDDGEWLDIVEENDIEQEGKRLELGNDRL